MRIPLLWSLACVAAVIPSCTSDTAPRGLRATPLGDGPQIIFDLSKRPLPNIPVPNDIATFADPTSRTGKRINVSMVAPTHLEQSAREGFADLEGWGTFAPISVSFAHAAGSADPAPAIDLDRVKARMQHDGHDMTDDPVYVVNLGTGVPVMLDMGDGNFPPTIRDLDLYYPNDPRATEQNVLFETVEEGRGLSQGAYIPSLDTDFDGVLDHPNTLPKVGKYVAGVDDVMTWYERETDTLILRPLLPMEEKTKYAVVLTDRLVSPDGKPVRSPFPFVHHPAQRDETARVAAILSDSGRANYYGSIAGTGLDHVAFTWSFTTAPTIEDLRLLRDGLHGIGPFSRMATLYPPKATAFRLAGLARDSVDDPPNWQSDPRCAVTSKKPYIVTNEELKPAIDLLVQGVAGSSFSFSQPEILALKDTLSYIDHLVVGSFPVSYLLGDPDHEDPNTRFQLNYLTGEGRMVSDVGHFILAVPKVRPGVSQPFNTIVWAHGTAQSDIEIVIRAGYFARQGLATFGFDGPGHGLVINSGLQTLVQGVLDSTCLVPVIGALTKGRARDLDFDGVPDPGGLLWTAHIFHSRDNVRQTVLDQIQATRVLRAFDGRMGDQDTDGDGKPNLLGDFDGDGTPDVGGANAHLYTSGDSYGGIVAQIHAAIDPEITAGASISGAGGLTDVATRSFGVVDSVFQQIISPLVISVPASDRPNTPDTKRTQCKASDRSVRMVVNDLIHSREIELACLSSAELDQGMTVVLTNKQSGETRCARTEKDGRFRVPVPANVGDRLDVQVFTTPDAVLSYKTCELGPVTPQGRAIRTFEQPFSQQSPIADGTPPCEGDQGCAQYRNQFIPVGTSLFAVQEGLGLRRQTPELRQLIQLTQVALDSSDPVNYAPLYSIAQNTGYGGAPVKPKGFMDANTVADAFVVVGAGATFARAMGVLPFLPPNAAQTMPEYASYATPRPLFDALGQETPNDVMINHYAIEGNERLARTPASVTCGVNYTPSAACTGGNKPDPSVCARTVFDTDWHAEGKDLYGAQHLAVPLRLARAANVKSTDAPSLLASWQPRLLGTPFSADGEFTSNAGPLLALVNAYVNPLGQHVWTTSNPCKAWDDAVYYDHLLGRFLATDGSDIYFLSHPQTHGCMASQTCDFLK